MRGRGGGTAVRSAGLVAVAVLATACDGLSDPTVDEPEPGPIEEAVDHRCDVAPDGVVAAIEAALTVDAELEHPRIVTSEDHDDVAFVAAELVEDPSEAEPLLGTWAVRGDPGAERPDLLAVDASARASTDLPDGTRELGLSAEDDGAEEALACAEEGVGGPEG